MFRLSVHCPALSAALGIGQTSLTLCSRWHDNSARVDAVAEARPPRHLVGERVPGDVRRLGVGETRADIRVRVRGIVIRIRVRYAATRVRVVVAAIDHTAY